MEPASLLLWVLFLVVAYFVWKISEDKRIKHKYSTALKYILIDISDLKKSINNLKKETSDKWIKQELKIIKSEIQDQIEKDANKLLLSISDISEWNDYKYSDKLHKLKEDIEHIEDRLNDIEDKI